MSASPPTAAENRTLPEVAEGPRIDIAYRQRRTTEGDHLATVCGMPPIARRSSGKSFLLRLEHRKKDLAITPTRRGRVGLAPSAFGARVRGAQGFQPPLPYGRVMISRRWPFGSSKYNPRPPSW